MTHATNDEEDLQMFQMKTLDQMGEEVIQFGTKHRGNTFLEAYQDKGYVKWHVDHTIFEKSSIGVKKFVTYMKLKMEQMVKGQGKGNHPKMPMTSAMPKVSAKARPPSSSQEAMISKTPPGELPEVGSESDWDPIQEVTKSEILEGEVMNLHSRLDQVEKMGQRITQVEGMLHQIMNFMQNKDSGSNPP